MKYEVRPYAATLSLGAAIGFALGFVVGIMSVGVAWLV